MNSKSKQGRLPWTAPKLQRLKVDLAEGNGGTKSDGQSANPRAS